MVLGMSSVTQDADEALRSAVAEWYSHPDVGLALDPVALERNGRLFELVLHVADTLRKAK